MKTFIRLAFAMISMSFFQFLNGQITKLSSKTELTGVLVNNRPVFVSAGEGTFWTSDGTQAGTVRYTNKVKYTKALITYQVENRGGNIIAQGKLYFSGDDAAHGSELWVTDGTDAGTSLIKDIVPGADSSIPTRFFQLNNQVFFFTQATGGDYELWKTDGTTRGTVMVKDIFSKSVGSIGNDFFSNNGVVYFAANDGVHGNELWKTDGTGAGTMMVKDIDTLGNGFGDKVKFIAL